MQFTEVKCVMGAEDYNLKLGHLYLAEVTKNGHYKLLETSPPEPYNCFHKERFEPTGKVYSYEEIFGTYEEYYYDHSKGFCEECEDYFVYLNSLKAKHKDNGDTNESQS